MVSDAAGNASSFAQIAAAVGETPSVTNAPAVVAKLTLMVSTSDAPSNAALETAMKDSGTGKTLQDELAKAGVETTVVVFSVTTATATALSPLPSSPPPYTAVPAASDAPGGRFHHTSFHACVYAVVLTGVVAALF